MSALSTIAQMETVYASILVKGKDPFILHRQCHDRWAPSQYKDCLIMAISMLKIRRPLGRLIFNMGIAIPGKTVLLIETAPWYPGHAIEIFLTDCSGLNRRVVKGMACYQ